MLSKRFSNLRKKVVGAVKKLSKGISFLKKKEVIPVTEVAIPGCILSGTTFKIGEHLGQGGFGKVYKATKGEKQYALKICQDRTKIDKLYNRSEAAILADIYKSKATEYLLSSMQSFPHGSNYVFVMEELGPSLYEDLESRDGAPMHPNKIKTIMYQVLLGSSALLDLGIVHHDIKLDNVLFCKGNGSRIKLADFGLAIPLKDVADVPYGGTLAYCSPEEVLGYPCTEKIDIWSIGCVLFVLLTGIMIFPIRTEEEYVQLFLEVFGIPKELEQGLYFRNYFKMDSESGQIYPRKPVPSVSSNLMLNNRQGFKNLIEFGFCNQAQEESSAEESTLQVNLILFLEMLLTPAPSKRPNPKTALFLWNKVFEQ